MAGIKCTAEKGIMALIAIYQYCLRPLLGNHCRFHPGCSEYAKIAITRFGVLKGGLMFFRRILKCHPWHEGGFDPVPPY